jgi:flagellar hook assembly protein FlgD
MLIDLVPSEFHLGQNYPNPFREQTRITYCVPEKCRVMLTIYDSDGGLVERLVDEEKSAGTYEVTWNANNLPSGFYQSVMNAGSFTETKKMLVSK